MVQQQLMRCCGWKLNQFWLDFRGTVPNFSQLQPETQHGVTHMGHQELVAH